MNSPYKTVLAAFGICLMLLCGQCLAAEPLTVVTTTPVLKSLAEAVGGDKVKVTSIGAGDEDPHFIQAKPSFMILARNADLWIRVGMELEIGYEGLILDGSRNGKIRVGQPGHLDVSENVIKLEVPKEKITRDLGDVHPMGNPHYWLDPLNGRLMAKTIADRLAQLDPADADLFQKNYKTFEKALDERMFGKSLVEKVGGDKLWVLQLKHQLLQYLDDNKLHDKLGGWQGRLLPLAGQSLVTEHKSWIYFTNRFGLSVAGELEPKPGIPPSPSHLAEIIDLVKKSGIKVILLEPFYERKAADLVGEKTGAKVVVCASAVGGQKEATDYLALMDLIVNSVGDAMGAPCDAHVLARVRAGDNHGSEVTAMPSDTARNDPIIVCDHVHLAYGRDEVVHDACLTIQRGSFLPFVGPNGAGKTTLLRAILGLLKPRKGRIVTPFHRCPPGYVPQQKSIDRLYPVSTRQIVAMGLYPHVGWWRRISKAQKETVEHVLEQFNLAEHAKKTFGELSGGMRQKAMIARALAGGAEVFIMDEPTSELDEQSEKDLLGHLFRLSKEQGKTVLLAHHGLDHISELAPVLCMVKHGRVSMVKTQDVVSVRGEQHA